MPSLEEQLTEIVHNAFVNGLESAMALALSSSSSVPGGDKMTKAEANYTDQGSVKKQCEGCDNFKSPAGCTMVAGRIDPTGSCDCYESAGQEASEESEPSESEGSGDAQEGGTSANETKQE